MQRKPPIFIAINYLYFGTFLALLITLSLCSILVKENLSGSLIFFSLYAIGQALLETAILILVAWLIQVHLGNLYLAMYIGLTFILGALHVMDFLVERIVDLSIWETFDFVFDESLSNFILLLEASGVPLWAWGLFFISLLFAPFFGWMIYRFCDKLLVERQPYRIKRESLLLFCFCIPVSLFFWDLSSSGVLHPDTYTEFIKSLPWKVTFFKPKSCKIHYPNSIRPPLSDEALAVKIAEHPKPAQKKLPNIYLFIIESFRGDYVTEAIAPQLSAFKKEAIHFDTAVSNANASHISWFSLIHSQYPLFWSQTQNKEGSPALRVLKEWGYQIRVYTSAQLSYYGMEDLLFGKEQHLLSAYNKFHHGGGKQAWESDAETLDALVSDLSQNELKHNQVFLIFWDATHFNYSWPKETESHFTPFATDFDYFRAFHSSHNIEFIKNSYRNAVHYVDSLFGQFLEHVPHPHEAIVLVSGDHGEEFFDHGHIFHGSHLTHEQIHIPLYMRFGTKNSKTTSHKIASQVDIFPTVIDYLSRRAPDFLAGQSLFQERKWPYALSARLNASRAPYEFCLNNGNNKLIAQFKNRNDIFASNTLQILSVRSCQDKCIPQTKNHVEEWVHREFGPGLDHLFDRDDFNKKPIK